MIGKGTAVHEIINLPVFWLRVMRQPAVPMEVIKKSFGRHAQQYFLLVKPQNEHIPRKVIVYFHGGGWRFGSPEMFLANANLFVKAGFWVFLPAYRKVPLHDASQILEDAANGTQAVSEFLTEKMRKLPPVILGGMSAGGNLAAHLAFNPAVYAKSADLRRNLRGVLLFGAPLNLSLMSWSPILASYAGRKNSALFRQANPYFFLGESPAVPTLIVHGEKDGLVNFASAQSFAERLTTLQPRWTDFVVLKDGTHLDAVSWVHEDGALRTRILQWLDDLKI
jgi:acetyl esterase/lipase